MYRKLTKHFFINFFLYIKCQVHIFRKTKKGYEKKALKSYQNLSGEETNKNRKNGSELYKNFSEERKYIRRQPERDCYKNLCEDEKQRLAENKKKLYNAKKIKVRQYIFWFNI